MIFQRNGGPLTKKGTRTAFSPQIRVEISFEIKMQQFYTYIVLTLEGESEGKN